MVLLRIIRMPNKNPSFHLAGVYQVKQVNCGVLEFSYGIAGITIKKYNSDIHLHICCRLPIRMKRLF